MFFVKYCIPTFKHVLCKIDELYSHSKSAKALNMFFLFCQLKFLSFVVFNFCFVRIFTHDFSVYILNSSIYSQ